MATRLPRRLRSRSRHRLLVARIRARWSMPRRAVAGGRALTIEDYYRVQSVAGVQISPDARVGDVLGIDARRKRQQHAVRSVHRAGRRVGAAAACPARGQGRERRRIGPRTAGCATRSIARPGRSIPPIPRPHRSRLLASRRRAGVAVGAAVAAQAPGRRRCRRGHRRAPMARGPSCCGTSRSPHDRSRPSPTSSSATRSDFRARSSTGWSSSATASRFRPRTSRHGPPSRSRLRPSRPAALRRHWSTWTFGRRGSSGTRAGRWPRSSPTPTWRDELKYDRPDLWTIKTDGLLQRLTDDGYVHSDLEFSPDGKYLSYARTFGTDMIIQQKLNHGGPRDLYRPAGRRRRADQPHSEMGSGAGRLALVAGRQIPLLQRRQGRREPSVPRVGARRRGRAAHDGPAPSQRLFVRPRLHDDGLYGRPARRAARRLRRAR